MLDFATVQLSVLTLNVWALPLGLADDEETRIQAIAKRFPDFDADVMAFQEVWTQSSLRVLTEGGRRAGYKAIWHRPAGTGSSGLLVLSRLPIVRRRFVPFRVEGLPERIDHSDYYGGKGFALLELATQAGRVTLLDTHLHARYAPDAASDTYLEMRVAQVVQIAAEVATIAQPLVAMGDFNLREGEAEYTILLGLTGWVDAAAERNQRQATIVPGNTYRGPGSHSKGQRIDYVFTHDGLDRAITPESTQRVFDEALDAKGRRIDYSDHAGVQATLRLGGPPHRRKAPSNQALVQARKLLEQGLENARARENVQLGGAAGVLALAGLSEIGARRVRRRAFLRAAGVAGAGVAGLLGWLALGPSSTQTAGFEAVLEDLSGLAIANPTAAGHPLDVSLTQTDPGVRPGPARRAEPALAS